VSGRLWGTFLPAEEPTSDTEAPRGVSILARDMQSVAIYDARGQFVGIRRPDSGRPIEARLPIYPCVCCSDSCWCLVLPCASCNVGLQPHNCRVRHQRKSIDPDCALRFETSLEMVVFRWGARRVCMLPLVHWNCRDPVAVCL
jgi:hypothetical protein